MKTYYNDGIISSEKEYNEHRELHGWSKFYREDGSLRRAMQYKNGILHGECINYYHSGAVISRVNYVHGEIEGEAREYHESGSLRSICFIHKGHYQHEFISISIKGVITKHCLILSGAGKVPLDEYIQDPRNITPEEEVTLTLLGIKLIDAETRQEIYKDAEDAIL